MTTLTAAEKKVLATAVNGTISAGAGSSKIMGSLYTKGYIGMVDNNNRCPVLKTK